MKGTAETTVVLTITDKEASTIVSTIHALLNRSGLSQEEGAAICEFLKTLTDLGVK